MIYIAHAQDYREDSHGRQQWDFALSNWQGVSAVAFADIPDGIPMYVLSPRGSMNFEPTLDLPDSAIRTDALAGDVCLVFGSDYVHLEQDDLPRVPDAVVTIPFDGHRETYSFVACAIVLHWILGG